MKPLTLVYCCHACGVQVVSPFPRPHYGTPEICPECFLSAKLANYVPPADRARERWRREKAKRRAERIACNMAAHPAALDACADGIEKDMA